MPFGNSERSWLDEFWSLWHPDRPVDLEATKPCDLWVYDDTPKEPNRSIVETLDCHFTPCTSDPIPPKLDEN